MKKLVFGTCVFFLGIVAVVSVLELIARKLWHKKYIEWLGTQLHGYDYVDKEKSLIIPKPNTVKTVSQHRADLQRHGKALGLKFFDAAHKQNILSDTEIIFQINSHGFKGPEFIIPKPDSIFRILTLGNSCTWGPANDYYTYPRVMERELNSLVDENFKIEVVNGGVQGYNFERVLKRIDEYLVVEPDHVTIYLGWNRTIGRADPDKNQYLYRNFALYKMFYHFLVNRKDTGLAGNFKNRLSYNPNDLEMKDYESYNYKYSIRDLNELITIIHQYKPDIKITIITIAGLFDKRVAADKRALEIAYPISASNNLYAYSVLTHKWNFELKKYAEGGRMEIIDFEDAALELFNPRSKYFADSVHPTNEAHLKIGKFFAAELVKLEKFKTKDVQLTSKEFTY